MSPHTTILTDNTLTNTSPPPVPLIEFDYRIPSKKGGNIGVMDYRQMLAGLKCPIPALEHHEIIHLLIKKACGSQIPVDLYRSTVRSNKDKSTQPTLIFIAGTAFFAHELDYTKSICSHMVNKTDCQIFVVQHRLAPEDIFPAAINDVISLIDALTADATKYHIDLSSLGLLGYSSGANLAAAASIERGDLIKFQILVSGIFALDRYMLSDANESRQLAQNEEKDSIIKKEFVEWFIDSYAPASHVMRTNPLVSPLRATNFEKWPETAVICGQNDFFLGDNELLSEKLKKYKKLLYLNTPAHHNHGSFWNNPQFCEFISAQFNLILSSFEKAPISIPNPPTSNQTFKYAYIQHLKAQRERGGRVIIPTNQRSSNLLQRSTAADNFQEQGFSSSSSSSSSENSSYNSYGASPESSRESSPESSRESSPESSRESSPESSRESSPESSRESSPESSRGSSPEAPRESSAKIPYITPLFSFLNSLAALVLDTTDDVASATMSESNEANGTTSATISEFDEANGTTSATMRNFVKTTRSSNNENPGYASQEPTKPDILLDAHADKQRTRRPGLRHRRPESLPYSY